MMDATGMKALEVAWEKMQRDGVTVLVTAIQPQPMKVMLESGLADRIGIDNFCANIDDALNTARRILQPAPVNASGLRRSRVSDRPAAAPGRHC